jgi:hypothetical protein
MKSLRVIPFLTCWLAADSDDRCHLSAIFERILREHQSVDEQIFELIELVDRTNAPMAVDPLLVGRGIPSSEFAM